jgi:transcriptional regulator with PAS, ATPase and Fis domain
VAEARFREDLYYRLRVIPIEVPPLRERREDMLPLIRHLLQRIGQRHGRSLRLAPTAVRALLAYEWPGNVRELENVLEYATTVCEGQTIHLDDMPPEVLTVHGPVSDRHACAAAGARGVDRRRWGTHWSTATLLAS